MTLPETFAYGVVGLIATIVAAVIVIGINCLIYGTYLELTYRVGLRDHWPTKRTPPSMTRPTPTCVEFARYIWIGIFILGGLYAVGIITRMVIGNSF